MALESYDFVEWREQFISQERGSRVVHYYLEDSSGKKFLAVIGTERSLRHMLYVVSEDFAKLVGSGREGSGSSSLLKWRSRREAVDWLTSFLPKKFPRDIPNSPTNDMLSSPDKLVNGMIDVGSFAYRPMDQFSCSLKNYNSDIIWSGTFWICGKQLRHYQAFCRNGTTILNHSFVLVMSEDEENCYLAYLEDMYEDKKGQKKVKVRWFHRHQEVAGAIPPPKPHSKEAFITPYSQVISAECVDDVATILTPDHYEKCLLALQHVFPDGIYICCRQYSKNKFKPFDLGSLAGYSDQPILSCLEASAGSEEDYEDFGPNNNGKLGSKRIRTSRGCQRVVGNHLGMELSGHANRRLSSQSAHQNLRLGLPGRKSLAVKFIGPRAILAPPFKVGDKIESLCQDSGIRGCWFRCTVLRLKQKRLKVRYNDVQTEDGCGNLEEWIPAYRLAAPDKLGMRFSGRLTVRPCRIGDFLGDNYSLEIGYPVDAWWNDGWWEGVVIGINSCGDDGLQVYFPGEGLTLVCNAKNLRISKEWTGNKWVDIQAKPDVLSAISAVSPSTKLSANSMFTKGSDSGGSATCEQDASVEAKEDATEEEMQAADVLTGLLDNPNHDVSVNSHDEVVKASSLDVKGMYTEVDEGNGANS